METLYIGFWLTNLIIPGDPETVALTTPAGSWTFRRNSRFDEFKPAVCDQGQCAETYSVEGMTSFTGSRSAALDGLFEELIPLCLGASYLVGLSVTPTRGLPASQINFVQVGDHFPRPRAMASGFAMPKSDSEFAALLQRFVASYAGPGATEKARLLCHTGWTHLHSGRWKTSFSAREPCSR